MTVVIAGGDYPASNDVGTPISGIEDAEAAGALVFHAERAPRRPRRDERRPHSRRDGDRTDDRAARELAYDAAAKITFTGARYRTDIAKEAAVV